MALLELRGVSRTYRDRHRVVRAVNGVSLVVEPGETVGLIGESGSGKSTLGRLTLGVEAPDRGEVRFGEEKVEARGARGRSNLAGKVSVVFQEPELALDGRKTVGFSVTEPLDIVRPDLSRGERIERARRALAMTHLDADVVWNRLPKEISGGQQQRVGIARAIVTEPSYVLLDEPTASLDLTIRVGVLQTLAELQRSLRPAYLLISHDMATIAHLATRAYVMYQGRIVEAGPVATVLARPVHPYTRALIDAVPQFGSESSRRTTRGLRLKPAQVAVQVGCPLSPRCPFAIDRCVGEEPPLTAVAAGHEAACFRAGEDLFAGLAPALIGAATAPGGPERAAHPGAPGRGVTAGAAREAQPPGTGAGGSSV